MTYVRKFTENSPRPSNRRTIALSIATVATNPPLNYSLLFPKSDFIFPQPYTIKKERKHTHTTRSSKMLVLYETALGYCLFKVTDSAKIESADLWKEFESPEKASKLYLILFLNVIKGN
jgi:hypothetical protein